SAPKPETKQAYEATLLFLEDGTRVLVDTTKPLSIHPQGQLHHLAPGSTFLLGSQKVSYRGVVDSTDPNGDFHELVVLQNHDGFNELHTVDEVETLGSEFWQLEHLTQEVVREQCDRQQEAYRWLGWLKQLPSGEYGFETGGKAYPMPSIEKIFLHLSDSPEFTQTLRTKEKQGFLKVVITPFALPLEEQIAAITAKVKALGGTDTYRSTLWQQNLGATFKYFTSLDAAGAAAGGVTKTELLSAPRTYQFLLDGYMVSVLEDMDDLPLRSESPAAINGRTPIKCGETGIAYQQKFAADPQYQGEQPVIPDEDLARFAQVFHEKYGASGAQIMQGDSIFDTKTAAWFVDTLASGILPYAYWDAAVRRLNLRDSSPDVSFGNLGPRASVRKPKLVV
ncbi:MAG: hypothetical protein WC654_06700, partial [Patescibacteria group bacterium]